MEYTFNDLYLVSGMDIGHCFLDGNADAVEFCPDDTYRHVLAASTYTLQEGDNPSRSGSISLFSVNAELGSFKLIHRVETSGIFDIKWSPVGGSPGLRPMLAQADSDGCVRIYGLKCSSDEMGDSGEVLKAITGGKIASSMCLCLDWNASSTSISVGLSDGSVSVLSFLESQIGVEQEWKAHDFETWAAAFDIHHPQLVYTASDDCKFSCWDLRESPSMVAFRNSKVHTMGICCITKSIFDPNIIFTGCYDEHLRIWDIRSISKPVCETSVCLGGGVWRIKQHPSVPGLLLAACMHNGFALVKSKSDGLETIETYNKHESLAYGADWQRGLSSEIRTKSSVIATCSFYDRLVRVWMPEVDLLAS